MLVLFNICACSRQKPPQKAALQGALLGVDALLPKRALSIGCAWARAALWTCISSPSRAASASPARAPSTPPATTAAHHHP